MMEKIIQVMKTPLVVPKILLMNYSKLKISERSLVVLIYLINDKNDIFNWRAKRADQVLKKSSRSGAPLPNQNLFKKDQLKKEK